LPTNPAPRRPRRSARRATDARRPAQIPTHTFPLDRIADAHDAVDAGATGKVLVEIP
jgi:hypothetical protein